jgi:hypothetical protein
MGVCIPLILINRSFMWHEDERVRETARTVVRLIADHRGGLPSIVEVVKQKYRTPAMYYCRLGLKIVDELTAFPEEALDLWLTITRLVKDGIVNLTGDNFYCWLQIPKVLP